jgi:hypothetical protein
MASTERDRPIRRSMAFAITIAQPLFSSTMPMMQPQAMTMPM